MSIEQEITLSIEKMEECLKCIEQLSEDVHGPTRRYALIMSLDDTKNNLETIKSLML